jgi:hypothetical protein
MQLVADALRALGPLATQRSHPKALRYAMTAYFNFRDAHPTLVRKPYLYFVDYGLDNTTRRGYVFDMVQLSLTDGPFLVAHGSGSLSDRDGVPTTFNNVPDSNACSLGLYITLGTYLHTGQSHSRSGAEQYSGIAVRLKGWSGQFNSNAEARAVVIHGAPYVSENHAGRSQGCPAMEMRRAARLIPLLANGAVVFLFSPNDARWIAGDPWVNGKNRTYV